MRFSSKEDLDVPIDVAFAHLADFGAHERTAIRRGVDVQRLDDPPREGVGAGWRATFRLRGKSRQADIVVAAFDPPHSVHFDSDAQGLKGRVTMELIALSPTRTRMAIVADLKPQTLSARLLIQSLKLTKKTLDKRYKLRVAQYAKSIEDAQTGGGGRQNRP